jgi:hypothetical protein
MGITWTLGAVGGGTISLPAAMWGGVQFVLGQAGSSSPSVYTSPTAVTWTPYSIFASAENAAWTSLQYLVSIGVNVEVSPEPKSLIV